MCVGRACVSSPCWRLSPSSMDTTLARRALEVEASSASGFMCSSMGMTPASRASEGGGEEWSSLMYDDLSS
jgi:hypothetical protein